MVCWHHCFWAHAETEHHGRGIHGETKTVHLMVVGKPKRGRLGMGA